jgi:hypothetical protein
MNFLRAAALALLALGTLAACHRTPAAEKTEMHRDVPPHGGTPLALGDDYRLELVRDADTGTLSAYVLDDEMEEFIRSPSPAIEIVVEAGGQRRALVLPAVANPATGETVGDTSLFQAQAGWLKTVGRCDGAVKSIAVRGTTFTDIPFSLPAPAN